MTSYLVDMILLVALILSSYRMAIIHRDIKRFRRHQNGYERALSKTSEALVDVGRAIQAVKTLSIRIDEARGVISSMEKLFSAETAHAWSEAKNGGFAEAQATHSHVALKSVVTDAVVTEQTL
jgi:hypothetical protein